MAAYPTSGLRDRARKDLRDLTCQVLCGTADCRRARAEKPAEFERVLEAWSASMPAAAALHVDTAIQAQADDRRDVAEAHRQLALELVDLMETELAARARRGNLADRPAAHRRWSGVLRPDARPARTRRSRGAPRPASWSRCSRSGCCSCAATCRRSRRRWRGRSSAFHRIRWSRSRWDRCTRRTPRRTRWSKPAPGGRAISRSGGRKSGRTAWSRRSSRIARPWPSTRRWPKRTCVSGTCCCSPARRTRPTPRSRAPRRRPAIAAGAISRRCSVPTAPTRAGIAPRRGSATRPRSRRGRTRSRRSWR